MSDRPYLKYGFKSDYEDKPHWFVTKEERNAYYMQNGYSSDCTVKFFKGYIDRFGTLIRCYYNRFYRGDF